jgi:hypothetical protein
MITGWYAGRNCRWSTDRERQELFDNKGEARAVCHELRILCPRNARVINVEVARDDPSLQVVPQMFATLVK